MGDMNVTVIGPSVAVAGNVSGDADVVVAGRLEGTVELTATFTVEVGGVVKADIHVRHAVIAGNVLGNIHGEETVELLAGCRVVGDIRAGRLIMADGALFRGQVEIMEGEPSPPARAAPPTASVLRHASAPASRSRPPPPPPPAPSAPPLPMRSSTRPPPEPPRPASPHPPEPPRPSYTRPRDPPRPAAPPPQEPRALEAESGAMTDLVRPPEFGPRTAAPEPSRRATGRRRGVARPEPPPAVTPSFPAVPPVTPSFPAVPPDEPPLPALATGSMPPLEPPEPPSLVALGRRRVVVKRR
jgi:cytoskeletal protein CcmA (bactofilin family)